MFGGAGAIASSLYLPRRPPGCSCCYLCAADRDELRSHARLMLASLYCLPDGDTFVGTAWGA